MFDGLFHWRLSWVCFKKGTREMITVFLIAVLFIFIAYAFSHMGDFWK